MKKILSLIFLSVSVFAADRPNLVFLFTDDQASVTMGCYGNPDAITPQLDQLADDGMIFDCHYVTTAICMASRANVMTGMFEYKNGCNFEHGALLRAHWEKSYPILLRKAGYRTAIAGKIGFEVADEPGKKGILPEDDFDKWGAGPGQTTYVTAKNKSMAAYAEKYPHSTVSYGAFGADFIKESKAAGKPFCLSISFKASHMPDTPDPQFDHIYAGKTFTKPENYGREAGAHFSRQSQQGRQFERFYSWEYADNFDDKMRRYHQQIYAVDVAVGMIRDALKENGVADNTVVIFTSDNGFFCGSHGYGSKVLPYEESAKVPLIIYDPRHPNSGKKIRSKALTGNVDFAPTMLALAGLPVPENMDGKNLMKIYDDPDAAIHESLPLINVWGPKACHSFGVVTKDAKYIYWNYGEGDFDPVEEMYVLSKDPLELQNAALNPEQKPRLKQMRKMYDDAVAAWKKDAVPYHNYQPFGTVFDRHIAWEDKGIEIKKPKADKPPRKKKRQKKE